MINGAIHLGKRYKIGLMLRLRKNYIIIRYSGLSECNGCSLDAIVHYQTEINLEMRRNLNEIRATLF
jgi:hypothetical protein